jgi:hypothetical protein
MLNIISIDLPTRLDRVSYKSEILTSTLFVFPIKQNIKFFFIDFDFDMEARKSNCQ